MSTDFGPDDHYGLPERVTRQWIVANSEPDEFGDVQIPEDRQDGITTHATYWPDYDHIDDCDCHQDESVMWTLQEYSGRGFRTAPEDDRHMQEQEFCLNTRAQSVPRYSDYRSCDSPWLGTMPAHWAWRRLKSCAMDVADLTSYRKADEVYVALEHVESWTGRISEPDEAIIFESQVKRFQSGDVLFGKLRPYLAKVTQPQRPGVCVGEFLVLRPREDVMVPSYLERLMRSKPMIGLVDASTYGAKMPRANWHFMGNVTIPLPPPEEQTTIVRYLDHADELINRYISAKERLITLLEEQRQAVIHQAVTRGLDPNVRLKPSGVECLGDVPAHWQNRRLRSVIEMRVSNVDKHTKDGETPIRLCNYVDVYYNYTITNDLSFMRATASPSEIERFRLQRNDVVITKDSETWDDIAVPALVTDPPNDLICGYHLAILRPNGPIEGSYLARVLQAPQIAYQFHVSAQGITRYGLTHHDILSSTVPLPPLAEQAAIAEYLDSTTAGIDAAIARAHRQIELLDEYRTRLIADVVTGQLDVRHYHPIPGTQ